ncbi:MAG: hypothetical protein JW927_13545 [Deltaproteobacteria bacterium]|nr:hypothetical protein [Deltaproteobacteria bacterium]
MAFTKVIFTFKFKRPDKMFGTGVLFSDLRYCIKLPGANCLLSGVKQGIGTIEFFI